MRSSHGSATATQQQSFLLVTAEALGGVHFPMPFINFPNLSSNMTSPSPASFVSSDPTTGSGTATVSGITEVVSSDIEDNFDSTFQDDNDDAEPSSAALPTTSITVDESCSDKKNPPSAAAARIPKKHGRSSVWKYFLVFKERRYKAWTYCTSCQRNIFYTDTMSTGMLLRHLRKYHRDKFDELIELEVENMKEAEEKAQIAADSQKKITGFVTYLPSSEKAFVRWVIETFQPLTCCEEPSFRTYCQSLSLKAPLIGREKLRLLLTKEAAEVRSDIKKILTGLYFACTTDSWTASNNMNYSTCTVHFIDKRTWILHRFALGIYKKTGTSKAEDVVSYCEGIWRSVDLDYKYCSAIVTDTEATMCKAGRLFIRNSAQNGGTTQWHGCIDHILELITKIAMKDYEGSEDAMASARALVGHFSSSSQAEQRLLGLQQTSKPVKCIQDVCTRWWSTFSMCERLLRLKLYFDLMQAEGTLDCNLSPQQWVIISDICALLKPFMFAQKTFEGETYVTISMVPYILYRIRSLLQEARVAPQNPHVANLLRKMANAFELHWGSGEPGTVSREYLTEGPNRRPRGMPLITLLASLLDPRFKFGPGLSQIDLDYLWAIILHQMIGIYRAKRANQHQPDNNNYYINNNNQQPDLEDGNDDEQSFDMFRELNHMRAAAEAHVQVAMNRNGNEGGDDHERAHAELTLYRTEPMLPVQKEDRSYNDPLSWWRLKAQQFPLLSELAIKYLCIPATSAPSERVFSTAGLTISNMRSRLDPMTANELVFLHESLPSLELYKSSIRGI